MAEHIEGLGRQVPGEVVGDCYVLPMEFYWRMPTTPWFVNCCGTTTKCTLYDEDMYDEDMYDEDTPCMTRTHPG